MDPKSYLVEVRQTFLNKCGSYEVFLQIMEDFKAQQINTSNLMKKVTKLFEGHNNLIEGFNKFIPKEYKIVPKEDEEALNFVKRVHKTFKDDHGAFLYFLEIIDAYRSKNKSVTEVYNEISVLFQGHRDLLFEFSSFLPDTNVKILISPPLNLVCAKKKRKIEEKSVGKRVRDKGFEFFDKVKATVKDSDTCQGLMTCEELYSNRIITRHELHDLVDNLIGEYPELVKSFDAFMENSEKTRKSDGICSSNYMEENFENLDLLKCEKISPSYRCLPMNYRKPAIMHESLSDGFVCVSPVKDNFKYASKNKYEATLFKCEDDIFELDMKIHVLTKTIDIAIALLLEVEMNREMGETSSLCLEEHFTTQQLKCIKRLFKRKKKEPKFRRKKEPKFLDSLRGNAYVLLPIALNRLILEQRKFAQIHNDSAIKWRKIFKDNHHRSLGLSRKIVK